MEYRLGTEHGIYTMDPACLPVLWIESGDTVDLECGTWDEGVRDYARELSLAEGGLDINPATGPVGVREARPGIRWPSVSWTWRSGIRGLCLYSPAVAVLREKRK